MWGHSEHKNPTASVSHFGAFDLEVESLDQTSGGAFHGVEVGGPYHFARADVRHTKHSVATTLVR